MEQLDMSRLQRRKPDMSLPKSVTVENASTYRRKAETLALSMLHEHGIRCLCVDSIKDTQVDDKNWVDCAHRMFNDTLFFEGRYEYE